MRGISRNTCDTVDTTVRDGSVRSIRDIRSRGGSIVHDGRFVRRRCVNGRSFSLGHCSYSRKLGWRDTQLDTLSGSDHRNQHQC